MKHLPQPRSLLIGILIAVLYFGFRKLGLLLAIGGGVTPLSPSFGLAWALLLPLGAEYWPAIFLAGFLSAFTFGFPWVIAAGLAATTAITVIAGVRFFSWFSRFRKQLGHFEFLVAGLATALLTPVLGATLTFAVQRLSSARPGRDLPTWDTLWLENMLAILIAATVVIPMLEPIQNGWKDWDLGRLVRISAVMMEIRKDAVRDGPRRTWAQRIVERKHHRVVHETGDNADQAKLQRSKRILKKLQSTYETVDFYLDDSPVSIYKLSIPGEQEEPQVQHLYIRERNGNLTLLAHESAIISKIPKRVRTVRIFADGDEKTLKEIRDSVKDLEKTL